MLPIGQTIGAHYQPWYLQGEDTPAPIQANRFIGAASFAEAKINLITPGTLDLIDGTSAPTWASETGALFNNAAGQYLRTGITTGSGNITAFICFTVNEPLVGDASVFGGYGAHQIFIQRHNSVNALVFGGDAVTSLADQGLTSGTHTLAMTDGKAWLDGVNVTRSLTLVASDQEFYLGALNYYSSAIQSCGCYITHWAYWDTSLTDYQVAAVHFRALAEASNP